MFYTDDDFQACVIVPDEVSPFTLGLFMPRHGLIAFQLYCYELLLLFFHFSSLILMNNI